MIQKFIEKAAALYNVDLSGTKLVVTDMGKSSLGQAIRENDECTIRLNSQVPQHMLEKEVIPHEVAHLVCFLRPELGQGHDLGWKKVCLELGGIGTRLSSPVALKPLRAKSVQRRWLYRNGLEDVILTTIRHNKLQRGSVDHYIVNKRFKISAFNFVQEID